MCNHFATVFLLLSLLSLVFCEIFFHDGDCFFKVFFRNVERREETDFFFRCQYDDTFFKEFGNDSGNVFFWLDAPHEAHACYGFDAFGTFEAFFDEFAFFSDGIKELVIDVIKDGEGACADDRVAAEGGAVGAAGEDVLCLFAEEGSSDRKAAAQAFGSGDDVRGDVVVHVAVEFSCTAISCLYFVDDEEDVMFLGISADAFEEVFIEGMDAAFALDRFYHDGADFRMGFAEFDEGIEVIGRCVEESFCQGEEVLMEYVLAGCSEGGDGTAVEAVVLSLPYLSMEYFLAPLMAHSLASAPELEKNTSFMPVFSQSACARSVWGMV